MAVEFQLSRRKDGTFSVTAKQFFLSSEPRSGSPIRLRGKKTVDITVARRCKKRGMSWQRNGANALLKLKVLKLNGDWDVYWQEWRKEFPRYAA